MIRYCSFSHYEIICDSDFTNYSYLTVYFKQYFFRVSASRAPPRGDGGQRSKPVIRLSPWITAVMPSWQAHRVSALRCRVSDAQYRRQVRVRKRARWRRHQATAAQHWLMSWLVMSLELRDE